MRTGVMAVDPRVDESERERELREHIRHACILIIDDSATVRSKIASVLRDAGHENLVLARDGVQGLQAAKTSSPALIVSDLVMPNMDGFELCRQIRLDPQLR